MSGDAKQVISALAVAKAELAAIIAKKRDLEDGPGPLSNLTWQYASGMMYGALAVVRALEAAGITLFVLVLSASACGPMPVADELVTLPSPHALERPAVEPPAEPAPEAGAAIDTRNGSFVQDAGALEVGPDACAGAPADCPRGSLYIDDVTHELLPCP